MQHVHCFEALTPSHDNEAIGRMEGKARLFALDFLRGLCLILMTMDHLPRNVFWRFSNAQFGPFGFFTAASAFVFISGLVSANAYGSLYDVFGAWSACKRVLRRALQLYVVNTTILCALFFAMAFHLFQGERWEQQFPRFFDNPQSAILDGILLLYRPGYLDILPMYVLFLLMVVPVLAAIRRRLGLYALAISFLVWLLAQLSEQHREAFNPLGYQVLFALGLVLGRSGSSVVRFLRSGTAKQLARASAAVVIVLALLRLGLAGFGTMSPPIVGWRSLTHLENNGPLRLLDFALVAFLVAWVWLNVTTVADSRGALSRWIAGLGRHSLLVFAWSIVATYASIALMPERASPAWALLDLLLTVSSLAVPALIGERLGVARNSASLARIH